MNVRQKQPELIVTVHNPNTPENTRKLLAQWYAESIYQLVHDPKNAGKTMDEILAEKISALA